MSQVKFNTSYDGKLVQVMSGWDRQLGYYHLTIFDKDPEATEEVLWGGLSKLGFCKELSKLKKAIEDLGIQVPSGFYERIERREGNVIHDYLESRPGGWRETRI